ncbi:MAG: O-antigen ligase family protein [Lachnospiraceae bacterium]|nr:O-antigen ligase family protein [Lachnospiraceae bacterium]
MGKVNVKVKKRESLSDIFRNIATGVTGFFVFLILTVFPLYTHDMYFDILKSRYVFFKVWTLALVFILLGLGIAYLFIDYNNNSSSPSAIERFLSAFKLKNIKKHIIITDIFFVIMLFCVIISAAGSNFKEEAFFGTSGRYQGTECWILYFLTYVAISRTFKFKIMYLDYAIIAGIFSCIWGITDFLYLDVFNFFANVSDMQKSMFASSVGNLNTFTNYTVMVFAVSASLFIIEKQTVKKIFYLLATLVACAGSIFGLADNAFLGLASFYLFIPMFCVKNRRSLLRFFITIDVFLVSLYLFWCGMKLNHNPLQASIIMDLLNQHSIVAYLFVPFTVFIIVLYFILNKLKPNYGEMIDSKLVPLDSYLPKNLVKVYYIVIISIIAFIVFILIQINIVKTNADFWLSRVPSSHLFVLSDDWGTHCGHNWRIAFTNFTQNFSIFQKLFGYGPDTYLIVSERTFYEEMVSRYGEVYDSAHNEYINYLICEGAVGLIAYMGILISSIKLEVKNMKENPFVVACVMAVIAYAVQAIVNIAIPITTPVFFALMFICASEEINNKKLSINNALYS